MNKCKLGDLLTIKHGFPFKGEFFSDEGEYIVLTPGNFYEIGGFKRILGKEKYYLGTFPKEYLCKKGDFIVAMTQQAEGLLGSTAFVPEDDIYLHNQRIGLISVNEQKADKYYLDYLFRTNEVRKQIRDSATGSKVKHTSPDRIYDVEVYIHDLETQKRIGALLHAIDSKILYNNKTCLELESMAKTIYDYWFLQFEFPNENGKPYKSSGGKMVWNDKLKREVPEGWKIYKVRDCITHINTGLNPRDNFVLGNGDIKYITVKNLTIDGKLDFFNCDTIDENAKEIIHRRSDISKGDILFASIAPLGRCFLIQEEPTNWDINESVFSIRPNYNNMTSEYLYMFFMSPYFIKKAEHNSIGSVFNGIRISTLENMLIIVPPDKIMHQFKNGVHHILFARNHREKESKELEALRNFLLPLLMSGQVGFSN